MLSAPGSLGMLALLGEQSIQEDRFTRSLTKVWSVGMKLARSWRMCVSGVHPRGARHAVATNL